ncbi:MAG: hypothetical protein V4649_18080 [Bacteroidota bacterium]
MKQLITACILLGCTGYTYAQGNASTDITPVVKLERKADHYVGVQVNGLIRQVINFNNNASTAPVNPYLLTWSMNSRRTGWGVRAGIGYNYNSIAVNDGITESTSKLNDAQLRVGIERRFSLTPKWSAGVGLDGLFNYNDDITSSTIRSFDTVTTKIKSKKPAYGGGAMGWLRYNINDRVMIGTETSIYYIQGKEDRTVEVTTRKFDSNPPFNSVITTVETRSKPRTSEVAVRLPVVFYLVVKF